MTTTAQETVMARRKSNKHATAYAIALTHVTPRNADPIHRYVTMLRSQLAAQRINHREHDHQPSTPAFRAALNECITAAEQGATLPQLTTIATRHNLTPTEHATLGMTLFTAARLELLQGGGA